ncbi:hypothetical protein PHO31112_03654 [Pandoraea horticolens]|uniref:Uncharacterized protein n=1 Tax=Pandoraea horticolens TaxID=2508298 RepID=A0A5E4X4R9_9BURK|nr:hypothetical protein [Pandoraea horticolens]VVE31351.1 hypothetical protein PHO31112_03654 [Pandoraea horticolens]
MPHAASAHPPQAPAQRSLRVPRRARLGDPPLLRRVGNELAYTPTRCRVTASLMVSRIDAWWQRLPSSHPGDHGEHETLPDPQMTNAPSGEPARRVVRA